MSTLINTKNKHVSCGIQEFINNLERKAIKLGGEHARIAIIRAEKLRSELK
jgi:hypothetical protein